MRKPKFNDDISTKLLMYIAEGRTVKDTCQLVGITDMTLTRWRRRYPEFNANYLHAVETQQESLQGTSKPKFKTYRRNVVKLQQNAKKQAQKQKIEQELIRAKATNRPIVFDGFRIRYENIAEDHPEEPCINANNGAVEYLKQQGGRMIQFSLSADTFKRKYPGTYREIQARNAIYDTEK